MSLLYPLGLLGLIGIPILILIYILKNKYTEQVVSSTYIWTLSERFLKKRNPINRLVGIISLILQILVVLFVSIALAHPVFTVPNSAHEYCFVLDGSGSMNMTEGLTTRLERGKSEISSMIRGSLNGSSYTLIYAGTATDVVFERTENKEQALKLVGEVQPAYLESELDGALSLAQELFNETPWIKTYLVTDKVVREHANVEVINVASNVNNYAISDVEYFFADGKLKVTGNVISYVGSANINIELYIDGATRSSGSARVAAEEYEKTPFALQADYVDFESIRVAVTNGDSLSADNEVIIYSPTAESSFNALIVSDYPFFLNSAIQANGKITTTVIETADYSPDLSGYDLYIFDGVGGVTMPRDGAVWIIDPRDSVDGSGFTYQSQTVLGEGERLTYSSSSVSVLELLRRNLLGDEIYVKEYAKCGFYRTFYSLLTHEGNPLLFAGTNAYGSREIVVAFDLHKSNLPVRADFVTLVGNMLSYTFPNAFDKPVYACGETVMLNMSANTTSIRVESPLGNISYLNTGSDSADLFLTEAGLYTVTTVTGGTEIKSYIFATLPENERIPLVSLDSFEIYGEVGENNKSGTYDDLLAWFLVIAVLFAADWGVYCYEQYQLR